MHNFTFFDANMAYVFWKFMGSWNQMAQLNRNRKGAITQIWGKGDIQLTEGVRGNTYAAGRSVMQKKIPSQNFGWENKTN